jgi:hypothetical protein
MRPLVTDLRVGREVLCRHVSPVWTTYIPLDTNLFSEAVHWILETLHGWQLTHYLDDFFAVFPPGTDIAPHSEQFDKILDMIGLLKAPEKDANGTVVTHLGFEFDSMNMEVRLPPNKKLRALRAVQHLMNASSVSFGALEEVLGFLSHCCQVVPLGRPFLRRLFSLLRRQKYNRRHLRTHISSAARRDIRWWLYFLTAWSSVSMIRLSRVNYDAATDASGTKGIGGIFSGRVFSERMPSRHREKHINWKEMFAILHAFVLWHKEWAGGRLRLACDNSAVVDAVIKKSIKGETINPLQMVLLIAAIFDIEILIFWIPSEENIVADAASRHDFKKLTNLGFQVSELRQMRKPVSKISTLCQKLYTFLRTLSPLQPGRTTTPFAPHTKHTVDTTHIPLSLPPSNPSPTGSPQSLGQLNPPPQKDTSKLYGQHMSNEVSTLPSSTIPSLKGSSAARNGSMAKESRNSGSLSQPLSSTKSSTKPATTSTVSISKRRCAWRLPVSFDLVNLRGVHPTPLSYVDTLYSTEMAQSLSLSPHRRPTPSNMGSRSSLQPHRPHPSVLSPHSAVFIPASLETHHTPSFPAPSVHSTGNTSSTKSKNYSFELASRRLDSRAIPYVKEPQYPLQQMEYHAKKSNSSVAGKVTQSMSTSTRSAPPTIPKNFSN